MWTSEKQLVTVGDLGAVLSGGTVSCTLHFLCFLGERIWVWVHVLLGYVCMSYVNTIMKKLLMQVLSVCSVLCKTKR